MLSEHEFEGREASVCGRREGLTWSINSGLCLAGAITAGEDCDLR